MRTAKRLPRPLAVLVAVAIGLTVSLAGGAPAAAACGYACDGRDPQPAGGKQSVCVDDADTIFTVRHPTINTAVELRYSPNCRTAWARQLYDRGWLSGVLVESYYADGTRRMTQTDRTTGGPWSRMVNDANLTARACLYQYNTELDQQNDRRTIIRCTGRF
jgi:hypothetical protein